MVNIGALFGADSTCEQQDHQHRITLTVSDLLPQQQMSLHRTRLGVSFGLIQPLTSIRMTLAADRFRVAGNL